MEVINSKKSLTSPNLQQNNAKHDSKKDIYINGGIVVGSTAIGSASGYMSYKSDKFELKSEIEKAKTEYKNLKIPELETAIKKLDMSFYDKVYSEKKGEPRVFPNSIMLVGESSEVNNLLINRAGKGTDCRFVQIKHTDKISAHLKEAEARHKETGERTLLHIDGFDQLLNPKLTPDDKIESLKSVLSSSAKNYHSTIIFSTKDITQLNNEAIQPHRVERIDINIKKSDLDRINSATQKIEEFSGKLKNLSKTKLYAGAIIGLVIGAIGVGIKHLVLEKTEK